MDLGLLSFILFKWVVINYISELALEDLSDSILSQEIVLDLKIEDKTSEFNYLKCPLDGLELEVLSPRLDFQLNRVVYNNTQVWEPSIRNEHCLGALITSNNYERKTLMLVIRYPRKTPVGIRFYVFEDETWKEVDKSKYSQKVHGLRQNGNDVKYENIDVSIKKPFSPLSDYTDSLIGFTFNLYFPNKGNRIGEITDMRNQIWKRYENFEYGIYFILGKSSTDHNKKIGFMIINDVQGYTEKYFVYDYYRWQDVTRIELLNYVSKYVATNMTSVGIFNWASTELMSSPAETDTDNHIYASQYSDLNVQYREISQPLETKEDNPETKNVDKPVNCKYLKCYLDGLESYLFYSPKNEGYEKVSDGKENIWSSKYGGKCLGALVTYDDTEKKLIILAIKSSSPTDPVDTLFFYHSGNKWENVVKSVYFNNLGFIRNKNIQSCEKLYINHYTHIEQLAKVKNYDNGFNFYLYPTKKSNRFCTIEDGEHTVWKMNNDNEYALYFVLGRYNVDSNKKIGFMVMKNYNQYVEKYFVFNDKWENVEYKDLLNYVSRVVTSSILSKCYLFPNI